MFFLHNHMQSCFKQVKNCTKETHIKFIISSGIINQSNDLNRMNELYWFHNYTIVNRTIFEITTTTPLKHFALHFVVE